MPLSSVFRIRTIRVLPVAHSGRRESARAGCTSFQVARPRIGRSPGQWGGGRPRPTRAEARARAGAAQTKPTTCRGFRLCDRRHRRRRPAFPAVGRPFAAVWRRGVCASRRPNAGVGSGCDGGSVRRGSVCSTVPTRGPIRTPSWISDWVASRPALASDGHGNSADRDEIAAVQIRPSGRRRVGGAPRVASPP
jgi:hypothetical protein